MMRSMPASLSRLDAAMARPGRCPGADAPDAAAPGPVRYYVCGNETRVAWNLETRQDLDDLANSPRCRSPLRLVRIPEQHLEAQRALGAEIPARHLRLVEGLMVEKSPRNARPWMTSGHALWPRNGGSGMSTATSRRRRPQNTLKRAESAMRTSNPFLLAAVVVSPDPECRRAGRSSGPLRAEEWQQQCPVCQSLAVPDDPARHQCDATL